MSYSAAQPDIPSRAELVAYVDGRLDARRRRQLEAWLAAHPEAAAAVEEHRQVLETFQAARPPEPAAADWARVQARLERALAALPQRSDRPWRLRQLAAVLAAAAAVLLLATLGDSPRPRPQAVPVASLAAEPPIPVAEADEVEIVSIDAADLNALVVGHPPLQGPLVLATAGEVVLDYAEAGESGWVPAYQDEMDATPMYVVPMPPESGKAP